MKLRILILSFLFVLSVALATLGETKVYFSPEDRCDKVIIENIQKAKKTVDVAIYAFTKEELVDALIEAHRKGVKVRVLRDKLMMASRYSRDKDLIKAGIPVISRDKGTMHNKFVVVDSSVVITGSYNWTKTATYKNDENMVVLDDVGEEYSKKFEELWNRYKPENPEKQEAIPTLK